MDANGNNDTPPRPLQLVGQDKESWRNGIARFFSTPPAFGTTIGGFLIQSLGGTASTLPLDLASRPAPLPTCTLAPPQLQLNATKESSETIYGLLGLDFDADHAAVATAVSTANITVCNMARGLLGQPRTLAATGQELHFLTAAELARDILHAYAMHHTPAPPPPPRLPPHWVPTSTRPVT